MSKKNLAKRLIALVAIVAMFAAMTISASAASYESTTFYVNDETVKVRTCVKDLTAGDEVTYYAKNGTSDVYVNQYTANGKTMTQTYVADLEDIDGLEIKMAKVDKEFDNYAVITGADFGMNSFKITCSDYVKHFIHEDSKPVVIEEDEIVVLDGFKKTADGKKLSKLTATFKGAEEEASIDLTVVDHMGDVAFISPVAIEYAQGGIYVTNSDAFRYEAAEVEMVLEAEYKGGAAVEEVEFVYIGIQQDSDFREDDVVGKLFAVAYEINATGAGYMDYGIQLINDGEPGQLLPAYYSAVDSSSVKYAIALVDPELTSFVYRPYCKIGDTYYYGTKRTANVQ